MEASSENRRERGRRRVFSDEELGRPGLSLRQRQNRAYAERGRFRLSHFWGEEHDAPLCVLEEFGRFRDEERFGEAAWWFRFYARHLTAKQAASKIKHMRTGKAPEVGPAELFTRLMGTIRDFRITHPGASLSYVEREVELVLETLDNIP